MSICLCVSLWLVSWGGKCSLSGVDIGVGVGGKVVGVLEGYEL